MRRSPYIVMMALVLGCGSKPVIEQWSSVDTGGVADTIDTDTEDTEDTDDTTDTEDSGNGTPAVDKDGDGSNELEDCDDNNADIHPNATEVCDGVDNDCDDQIDDEDDSLDTSTATTWYTDADADGYGDAEAPLQACEQPANSVTNDEDCDDHKDDINPDADEVCDTVDNDCDGDIDDEDASLDTTTADSWYTDEDEDGYGDGDLVSTACEAPPDTVDNDEDCDDDDGDIHPDAEEVCDGLDNDCDGDIDADATDADTWYGDADGDGYGGDTFVEKSCTQPTDYVSDNEDCDDLEADVNPAATEVCDDIDNDCDGDIDDDDTDLDTSTADAWYPDSDEDGYGDDAATAVLMCEMPSGYTSDDSDCDDDDDEIYPDVIETCDGVDNDCDGTADDGALGSDLTCVALSCLEILNDGSSRGDGLYWLDPDGDGDTSDAWEAYCDMTEDGGGWTKLFSSHYPTFWTSSNWDESGSGEDDDFSILTEIAEFEDSDGDWTFRLQVGNADTWNTGDVQHFTVWIQGHDPFSDTTDGSDYTYIDGEESTTCYGFNGLHDYLWTQHGTYARTSDVDSTDSTSCWWMQVVPTVQYSSASSYPGYLEGYDGANVHTWQSFWVQ